MKDYKSLIADIRTEACELADKLKRLEVFMMSEDFCKISPEQKSLLETQYDLMAKYKVTLVKRAYRINYEHEHEKTCTCEPHVLDAMIYEAHQKIKDKQKVPREPPLEKAPATTDGPEDAPENDRLCQTCLFYKECPNGDRCKTCDNGSKWADMIQERSCQTCYHKDENDLASSACAICKGFSLWEHQ